MDRKQEGELVVDAPERAKAAAARALADPEVRAALRRNSKVAQQLRAERQGQSRRVRG
ncbi:MAG: hypothetical protein H0T75_08040 [Rhizobiales bacterium]|nr:hypothetical protein [Hyphomicrobiales bacterium]